MSEFPHSWRVNIRVVCGWWGYNPALVTQLCFLPAAGGRKFTVSHEISFQTKNPSSIYTTPQPPKSAFPLLRAPHLFCSPLASAIATFMSGQQKFYTTLFPLLTFWWDGLAKDDRQQIPISWGCHAVRCFPEDATSQVYPEEHLHLSCLSSLPYTITCNPQICTPTLVRADSEIGQTSNMLRLKSSTSVFINYFIRGCSLKWGTKLLKTWGLQKGSIGLHWLIWEIDTAVIAQLTVW